LKIQIYSKMMVNLKRDIIDFVEKECVSSYGEKIESHLLHEEFMIFYKYNISHAEFIIAVLQLFPQFGEFKNNEINLMKDGNRQFFIDVNLMILIENNNTKKYS